MKFVERQEKKFSFGDSGHGARNLLFGSRAKIKEQIEALRLRDAAEEMDYGELPNKLRRIIGSVRVQRGIIFEDGEENSTATEKDVRMRMWKQLQKGQELARADRLTPEWSKYLEKYCGGGAKKEVF